MWHLIWVILFIFPRPSTMGITEAMRSQGRSFKLVFFIKMEIPSCLFFRVIGRFNRHTLFSLIHRSLIHSANIYRSVYGPTEAFTVASKKPPLSRERVAWFLWGHNFFRSVFLLTVGCVGGGLYQKSMILVPWQLLVVSNVFSFMFFPLSFLPYPNCQYFRDIKGFAQDFFQRF